MDSPAECIDEPEEFDAWDFAAFCATGCLEDHPSTGQVHIYIYIAGPSRL